MAMQPLPHSFQAYVHSPHRQATIIQSSTVTATKYKSNGTADSNTQHLENVREDEDGDFVSHEELVKNAPVFEVDKESTRNMDSHQFNVSHLRFIIDGRSYIQNGVDFDNSRNVHKSQEGNEDVSYEELMKNAPNFDDDKESTKSMDSHIRNSVDFDNNVLKFQEGDEDVKADAFTLWQQTQEEWRKNSDDDHSESPYANWSLYLQQKKRFLFKSLLLHF